MPSSTKPAGSLVTHRGIDASDESDVGVDTVVPNLEEMVVAAADREAFVENLHSEKEREAREPRERE